MTKTKINAEVILASTNKLSGETLWTIKCTYPRFILAEVNTHRKFSRNTASSRAIPAKKLRAQVLKDPVLPVSFGANQKGMQSGSELTGFKRKLAEKLWLGARYPACAAHWLFEKLGVHKQITNRLIEPWMWVTQLISSTEWDNFFKQRDHKDAEPHIQLVAKAIKEAMAAYTPQVLNVGQWHIPYYANHVNDPQESVVQAASATCARLSYEVPTETGVKPASFEENKALFERLAGADPKHLSPLEHIAKVGYVQDTGSGNFKGSGFIQYRFYHE